MEFWSHFCATTGIKAFGFLSQAKSIPERLLWITTLTAGICLTLWDVSSTVSKYMSSPTATKVNINVNGSMTVDNILICNNRNFSLLNTYGLDISKDNQVRQLIEHFEYSNLTEVFLSGMQNLTAANGNLSAVDYHFPQLLYATAIMLANILRVELTEDDSLSTADLTWGLFGANQTSEAASLQLIDEFYQRTSLTDQEVIRYTAAGLWCLASLQIQFKSKNKVETYAFDPALVSWFGQTPFFEATTTDANCIRLSTDPITFKSSTDYISVAFDSSKTHKSQPNLTSFLVVGTDLVVSQWVQNPSILEAELTQVVTVQLVGHYTSIPSKTQPCKEQSFIYLDCMTLCKADYIAKHCGVNPLFSSFLPDNLNGNFLNSKRKTPQTRPKSLEIYPYTSTPECANSTKLTVRQSCRAKCNEPCEQKVFQLISKELKGHQSGNITAAIIMFSSFVYPKFVETLLIDSKQFLSQLGGNLSFWLGASFLVLLHVVVFVLKIPFITVDGKTTRVLQSTSM